MSRVRPFHLFFGCLLLTPTLLMQLGCVVLLDDLGSCRRDSDCQSGFVCGSQGSCLSDGTMDAGSDDAGSDDAGSDDPGSDDAGSDDAGSDDAGSDDGSINDVDQEPGIQIFSPAGGEAWSVGELHNIEWSTQLIDDVTITYSCDDGDTWILIAPTVEAGSPLWGSYPWIIPDDVGVNCVVLIQGYFGEAPTRSGSFSIESAGEQLGITILSPAGGEVWRVGELHNIEWSTQLIDDVMIMYACDGDDFWTMIEQTVDSGSPHWGSYPWTIPDDPGTDCEVLIQGYFGEAPTRSAQFSITP